MLNDPSVNRSLHGSQNGDRDFNIQNITSMTLNTHNDSSLHIAQRVFITETSSTYDIVTALFISRRKSSWVVVWGVRLHLLF